MPEWSAWPFAANDPYPGYHAARARGPVQWEERLGAHLVLSHEHAAIALRGAQWSSDPRTSPALLASLGGETTGSLLSGQSMLTSDPPEHTRLRRAVNRFFTPRAVAHIRGRVEAIVDAAFAPLEDGEPLELMGELAYPIPLAVIAELFDVGLEGAEVFRSETPTLARVLELDPSPHEIEEIGVAAMNVMLFLVPIVAQRRREPSDDLLSALVHPPAGGVALATEEIVTMCLLLLAAGHETTSNLLGNGTLALLEHPEQLQWLARHPERSADAVEELLRYDSPAQVASRIAREDLELGGVEIRAGQQALVVIGAANRDPACYREPDRLELTRAGAAHLAFGNGPHYCVGAGLARLEAQIAFDAIARWIARRGPLRWSYERDGSRTIRRLRDLRIEEATQFEPQPSADARRRNAGAAR